ncbi:hypothetical protein Hypma_011595 [Hypsizygus marmoreus]|uniref:Uncharacterized protein n=1 Tax=Hypsizygus marmoreus TaxID=39966 RepID=A0A369JGS8_HYPMA|nr:hypothetical protein Hypma_011595 [Hypsizygus marmoreus]
MLRTRLSNRLPRRVLLRSAISLPRHRCQSNGRAPSREDTSTETSAFVQESFAKNTLFVLDVGKRALKFSLIGVLALGATAAAAYEGVHLWIEKVELAPELNEEVKKWEWDEETEKWTGDAAKGGTDPGLGFKGRHTVRAAWMAYNWGVGYSTAVIGSETSNEDGLIGPGGLRVIDASIQRTEDFLRTAISIAEKRSRRGQLNPHTITELVARHANVLARLGMQSLSESRSQYERAWTYFSGQEIEAARIALRLGDINSRLGQTSDAISWWSKAIQIIRGDVPDRLEDLPTELESAPSSPAAQRLLTTTLVSLSAFFAQSGQLKQAQAVEEAALGMLRSIPPPDSLSTASPPQALHALYLLQRSSLLSIHLAEVLHAQRKPVAASVQWLTSAAESSERVARVLTGQPLTPAKTFPNSTSPPPAEAPPLPTYLSSRSMRKTASSLLRDARRTSAEAWNLIGILHETRGKNITAALHCYERAVRWAGKSAENSDVQQPAEDTLESDWAVFFGNYTRAKRLVEQSKT